MTTHTTPAAGGPTAPASPTSGGFKTPEGLRSLLIRLHESGDGAWERDREAGELMRHVAAKYLPLARKHGLDVWEVASAAFEAMLNPSARRADDPWAVVTRAVQVTCGAEARATGFLVSTAKARRASSFAGFHDTIRFAEREHLTDWHPALQAHPGTGQGTDNQEGDGAGQVAAAVSDTAGLFASLGWEAALAGDAVAYVASRLGDLSSRSRALEVLRRDRDVPARLGLPPRSWTALLRIVLGRPDPRRTGAPTRHEHSHRRHCHVRCSSAAAAGGRFHTGGAPGGGIAAGAGSRGRGGRPGGCASYAPPPARAACRHADSPASRTGAGR